jgi:hypothetical protein
LARDRADSVTGGKKIHRETTDCDNLGKQSFASRKVGLSGLPAADLVVAKRHMFLKCSLHPGRLSDTRLFAIAIGTAMDTVWSRIFTGVGSAVVTFLLSLFVRQRSQASQASKVITQNQKAGDHSTNIQIGNLQSSLLTDRQTTN